MKSRLLFYLILGIVLGACEHLEMPSNEDVSPQKESKAFLSAIKVADDFMGQLNGGTRVPAFDENPSYRDDSESNSHGTEKIYIGNCMVYGVTR